MNFKTTNDKAGALEVKKHKSSVMKIMDNNINNVLINENIILEPSLVNLVNILEENENLPIIEDNINFENIMNFDFKNILSFEFNPNYKEAHLNVNENGFELTSSLNQNENPTLLGRKRYLIEDSKDIEDDKEMLRKNIIAR